MRLPPLAIIVPDMANSQAAALAALPSVDRLLQQVKAQGLVASYGRARVTEAIRSDLARLRSARLPDVEAADPSTILERVSERLEADARRSLRPVFNLTGTVLHTNLGRAPLPEEAIEAMQAVARGASNLEYDIDAGRRGERDV